MDVRHQAMGLPERSPGRPGSSDDPDLGDPVLGRLLSPNRAMTVAVVGPRTGRLISLPLAVTDYKDERYLVSVLGNDANWIRNVRGRGDGGAAAKPARGRAP